MFLHVHMGGHDHHGHHHIHDHADIRPLRIAITITVIILALQIGGGLYSGSLALLSDAGHVFVDLASLLIAFFGLRIAAKAREQHDIRYIQVILGHKNLSTTEIYTQVSIRKLKEVHSATHPARLSAC